MPWFKGNIHTHTNESDGDSDPEVVVNWYRRHGYDFLVLTDHNHRTILDYKSGKRRFKRPLMIPGEEVTANTTIGTLPIHINGIGISRVIEPTDADDVFRTIQANVDAIIQAGGIASVNHPNYKWAIGLDALKEVVGASLLEVYSGVLLANDHGGPGHPSAEALWDGVLSSGRPIFGVAVDDAHHYRDFVPKNANPGRGWVVVRADRLDVESIVEALASGDFYSSTGVTLLDVSVTKEMFSLEIEQEAENLYTTTFIGVGGAVLAEDTGVVPRYRMSGDEGYVRATVMSSTGEKAWAQPMFLEQP